MKRLGRVMLAIGIFVTIAIVMTTGCAKHRVTGHGWSITADAKRAVLTIEYENLDVVTKDVHLNLREGEKLQLLSNWAVEKNPDKMIINTTKPTTSWQFNIRDNVLDVTCSSTEGVITALVPASKERIIARVAEPEKMHTYKDRRLTGAEIEEKSYIPSQAGHVMYTSLGLVEALNLHCLFDRKANIVIQFPIESKLSRNVKDNTLMDAVIPVINAASLKLIPDYYTKVLGMKNYIPYDDTYHKVAPTGWNSWLAFYRKVTEEDIVKNTDFIAENLKEYGCDIVHLDDGYDHPEHRCWYKDWDKDKFPHGPKWLADYIKSKGLIPGLWTVPYSYCVEEGKPEWYLRDREGNVIMDYQGGGIVDVSGPEVIRDYWRPLFDTLKAQGWEYYKFDIGSIARVWKRYHGQFYDTTKSVYDVSHETMKIFREIVGPRSWLMCHPDNWGARMGIVDAPRCGSDSRAGWNGMNAFLSVISNNTYQNHIVWYTNPDSYVIRGKAIPTDTKGQTFLTFEEAKTCVSLDGLTGLQFMNGDDLTKLSKDRIELAKKCMPPTPIFPIDLFGRGRDPSNYPEIIDLKVNAKSGIYDVIAETNWSETSAYHEVSFEKDLGLSAEYPSIVFDFWNQKLEGVFTNGFKTLIKPHDTHVFMIRRALNRPQLLATNRHITGAYSIEELSWGPSDLTLKGVSKTVPTEQYIIWIFIPEGFIASEANANIDSERIDILTERTDNLLKVSFEGQKKPVDWRVKFKQAE